MRRFVILLAALSALAAPVALAPTAAAGGPTSVLLVDPTTGRTAALYITDPDYALLEQQVAAEPQGEPQKVDESLGDRGQGEAVTVTWLIHDVSVWRVDRIFYTAPGGTWVLTQTAIDGRDPFAVTGFWHRPASAVQLRAMLDRIVFEPAVRTAVTTRVATTTVTAAAPVVPAAAAAPTGPGGANGGWLWGIVGVAAGAVGTVVVIQLLTLAARRRSVHAGPHDPTMPVSGGALV